MGVVDSYQGVDEGTEGGYYLIVFLFSFSFCAFAIYSLMPCLF